MRLIPLSAAALAMLFGALSAGCDRNGDAAIPGDGTFRAEKARAKSARELAEKRCEKAHAPAAREDCMAHVQAEYGRLVAAAELRRDAREADLPEIAKPR